MCFRAEGNQTHTELGTCVVAPEVPKASSAQNLKEPPLHSRENIHLPPHSGNTRGCSTRVSVSTLTLHPTCNVPEQCPPFPETPNSYLWDVFLQPSSHLGKGRLFMGPEGKEEYLMFSQAEGTPAFLASHCLNVALEQ